MWGTSCLASCCAACACQACKGLASSISRQSARIAYCNLFALSLLLAWMLRDHAWPILEKIPWINHFPYSPGKDWFATQAVLRVCFGSFSFFIGMALLMFGVKYQSNHRDFWHRGNWMIKLIIWSGLTVLCLILLPNDIVDAYGRLSRFGSGLFLLVQMVVLLDFTYNWNAAWIAKESQFWYNALLAVSFVCYITTFVFSGYLYKWFNPAYQDCELNLFFITTSLSLGIAFAAISVHPQVNGSLLPASVIALYCMYLCYSALSSEPRDYECIGVPKHAEVVSTNTLVMGMATTLISVIYSAARAGSSTTFLSPPAPREEDAPLQPLLSRRDLENSHKLSGAGSEHNFHEAKKSSQHCPVTVYSFFYLVFALASMYSAMLLTGWGNPGDKDAIDVGWPSVWVRIGTMWFTSALYIWSLIAPLVLPDRDFF
ncbi:probable serine incorporator [Selaginella moellendorffii]|uniref:probable serine incorporator n=1 Tax=Selaginella moellendorffii TaxID=88036 RepID=UPI000D1C8471|nr:probable serine incorporator [Selaginella moellendorffii]|eukprot:XP_024530239.1 probable serine incorporator [Selaginella moellendorffii]